MNGLIESVSHYVQAKLRQSNMLLQLQIPESLSETLADATQLQRVVLYFICKAIDAIKKTAE